MYLVVAGTDIALSWSQVVAMDRPIVFPDGYADLTCNDPDTLYCIVFGNVDLLTSVILAQNDSNSSRLGRSGPLPASAAPLACLV